MGTKFEITLNNLENNDTKMSSIFQLMTILRKNIKSEDLEVLRKIERYSNELTNIKNLNN